VGLAVALSQVPLERLLAERVIYESRRRLRRANDLVLRDITETAVVAVLRRARRHTADGHVGMVEPLVARPIGIGRDLVALRAARDSARAVQLLRHIGLAGRVRVPQHQLVARVELVGAALVLDPVAVQVVVVGLLLQEVGRALALALGARQASVREARGRTDLPQLRDPQPAQARAAGKGGGAAAMTAAIRLVDLRLEDQVDSWD
jgi:hypothetical protein